MDDDEICLAQSRIVEDWFQQKGIAAALTIETAGAVDAVDVGARPPPPAPVRQALIYFQPKEVFALHAQCGRGAPAFPVITCQTIDTNSCPSRHRHA
ncbi:MAG: hypothetical protein QOH70_3317 [Blastocatellia bacterium]|jgi:hypothetical protein|nr:hypothetical protein [Blastocatellia bacterium]